MAAKNRSTGIPLSKLVSPYSQPVELTFVHNGRAFVKACPSEHHVFMVFEHGRPVRSFNNFALACDFMSRTRDQLSKWLDWQLGRVQDERHAKSTYEKTVNSLCVVRAQT